MAFNEKEQPAKIFCLFHQKINCSCIAPVTATETLKMRLKMVFLRLEIFILNKIYNLVVKMKMTQLSRNVGWGRSLNDDRNNFRQS